MNKARFVVGSVGAYSITALFNAILVVIKETNAGVKTWLKVIFGHHWIGHGILGLIVFVLGILIIMSAYRRSEINDKLTRNLILTIIASTLLSFLIIAGFYLTKL